MSCAGHDPARASRSASMSSRSPHSLRRPRPRCSLACVCAASPSSCPAAAGLAVASAIAIGVTRPGAGPPRGRLDARDDCRARRPSGRTHAGPTSSESYSGAQDAAALAGKAAPGPVVGRAQRYVASLTLGGRRHGRPLRRDAAGARRSRAISAGTSSPSATRPATTAVASVTLRVPSPRSADAVTRLSALGTIVAQDVQIDDLQQPLDELDRAAPPAPGTACRTEGEARRLADLRRPRAPRGAQGTGQGAARPVSGKPRGDRRRGAARHVPARAAHQGERGRDRRPARGLDRALDKALAVLTWEAVVALAIAVAAAPLVLTALLLWAARRTQRRRADERLLAAS